MNDSGPYLTAPVVESAVALIGGLFGFGGPVEMLAGAQRAVELETDGRSPYYAIAHVSLGHAHYVAGDLDLAETFWRTHRTTTPPLCVIRVLGLSVSRWWNSSAATRSVAAS